MAKEVTITYFSNSCSCETDCIPKPVCASCGQLIKLSTYIPCRKKWQFTHWNTRPDGLGITYFPGELLPGLLENLCLYAQWED